MPAGRAAPDPGRRLRDPRAVRMLVNRVSVEASFDRGAVGGELVALLVIGVVSIPLGLWVFRLGERFAKRRSRLKRSG